MSFTYIHIQIVANIGIWAPTPVSGPVSTSVVGAALETPEQVVERLCDGKSHFGHYGFCYGQGVRIRTYVFDEEGPADKDCFWTRLHEARETTDFLI